MRIAVVPGDGVGPEVTAEALKVLEAVGHRFGWHAEIDLLPWGADHFLATGVSVPPGGFESLRRDFDAVLLGALGDPRVPDNRHAREILLGIRMDLDLYVNYRPVTLFDARLCPLKGRTPDDVRFVVCRENTEGSYVGVGGRVRPGTDEEIAIQEEVNTFRGVNRIVRYAFNLARRRGADRPRVCMADKSNAMTHGHALWQRVFADVAREFPDVDATHLYVDTLVLHMVREPDRFDVIVTNNLFGDIVTDLGAALQGGLGMAASANLHPGRLSMFEPVHGSAPPLAGRNLANPIGAILSLCLLLEHLDHGGEAAAVEAAVRTVVDRRIGTPDIGGTHGTREVGDAVVRALGEQAGMPAAEHS